MGERTRRIGGAVARRLLKPIPVIGTAVVIATAFGVLRRKGVMRGSVDIGLDLLPIIGTAKGVVELMTGDFIPDRPGRDRAALP
jgi:hypothetical protein